MQRRTDEKSECYNVCVHKLLNEVDDDDDDDDDVNHFSPHTKASKGSSSVVTAPGTKGIIGIEQIFY